MRYSLRLAMRMIAGAFVIFLFSVAVAQEDAPKPERRIAGTFFMPPWEPSNLSFDEALKADASKLAREYLELQYILNSTSLARHGATIETRVNGTNESIDSTNVEPFAKALTDRLARIAKAIEQRGYRRLAPTYELAVDNESGPALIDQSGFTFTLFTGNLHVGVVVDSEIAVERGDNPEVTWVGKATDEAIILKPVAVGMSATMIEPNAELKFTKTETLDERFAVAYGLRAAAYLDQNDVAKAMRDAETSMKLDPTCPLSYGIRGAIRATCSDAKYRDGRGAVEDARRFCELVQWEVWQGLAILAAAYAEAGDFEQAVVWAEKAAAMAPDEEKAEIGKQLELHRLGKPYRGPDGE